MLKRLIKDWLGITRLEDEVFPEMSFRFGDEQPAKTEGKGRVRKVIAPPEFELDKPNEGGRIVRLMPKQLRKIKDAQERAEQ